MPENRPNLSDILRYTLDFVAAHDLDDINWTTIDGDTYDVMGTLVVYRHRLSDEQFKHLGELFPSLRIIKGYSFKYRHLRGLTAGTTERVPIQLTIANAFTLPDTAAPAPEGQSTFSLDETLRAGFEMVESK